MVGKGKIGFVWILEFKDLRILGLVESYLVFRLELDGWVWVWDLGFGFGVWGLGFGNWGLGLGFTIINSSFL